MDYGMLNVGSVVLGLAALALPVVVLIKRMPVKSGFACLLISMTCCMVSLLFQMAYNDHLVDIGDWGALMDTSAAVVSISRQLVLVTVILNIAAFVKNGESRG